MVKHTTFAFKHNQIKRKLLFATTPVVAAATQKVDSPRI